MEVFQHNRFAPRVNHGELISAVSQEFHHLFFFIQHTEKRHTLLALSLV